MTKSLGVNQGSVIPRQQDKLYTSDQVYRVARGSGNAGWPSRDYSFEQIKVKARQDQRSVRDGYGRTATVRSRKLVLRDRQGKRSTIVLAAVKVQTHEI